MIKWLDLAISKLWHGSCYINGRKILL